MARPKRWTFARSPAHRALRRDVFLRDDFTCRLCGWRPPTDVIPAQYDGRSSIHTAEQCLHLDHVQAFSRGGSSTDPANLQTLCGTCNGRKGAR